MERRLKQFILLLILFFVLVNTASAQEYERSISAYGFYITSSRLFPNAEAADPVLSNYSNDLNHVFGYGINIRYTLPGVNLIIGFNTEFFEKKGNFLTQFRIGEENYFLPTVDGYRVIPIEVSAYARLPFSSDKLKIYIGGGIGLYFGEREFTIAGVAAETLGKKTYTGIHVMSGVDYYIAPRISLRGELKFRDPEIDAQNRFVEDSVVYDGKEFSLPTNTVQSRINVHGIVFSGGIVFHL